MSDTLREAVVNAAARNRLLSTYKAFTEGARAAHLDAAEDLDAILAAHPDDSVTEAVLPSYNMPDANGHVHEDCCK